MNRKKILVLTLSLILVVSVAIGGTTYALFTGSAVNSGNSVAAGTVNVVSERDDVPFIGPMFYTDTNTSPGSLATGLWAPGDKHTRGLFLENKGSLRARLSTLEAVPEIPAGTADSLKVSSDNDNFAKNANVLIWKLESFTPFGKYVPWPNLDAGTMDDLMEFVNESYQDYIAGREISWTEEFLDGLIMYVNDELLDYINRINADRANPVFRDKVIKVVKLYREPLIDLVNTPANVKNFNITTENGDVVFLAFTIHLNLEAPNELQGATPYYTFKTTWEQTRNNP